MIRAEGRDTRGQGNASANVTATLRPTATAPIVAIDTDLQVTGKVAQFGRGVMADVSSKLLGQFVECLHSTVLVESRRRPSRRPTPPSTATPDTAAPDTAAPGTAAPDTVAPSDAADAGPAPGVRTIDAPEARAVDLGRVAGGAVAKRLVPVLVAGIVVIGVVVWLVTR